MTKAYRRACIVALVLYLPAAALAGYSDGNQGGNYGRPGGNGEGSGTAPIGPEWQWDYTWGRWTRRPNVWTGWTRRVDGTYHCCNSPDGTSHYRGRAGFSIDDAGRVIGGI